MLLVHVGDTRVNKQHNTNSERPDIHGSAEHANKHSQSAGISPTLNIQAFSFFDVLQNALRIHLAFEQNVVRLSLLSNGHDAIVRLHSHDGHRKRHSLGLEPNTKISGHAVQLPLLLLFCTQHCHIDVTELLATPHLASSAVVPVRSDVQKTLVFCRRWNKIGGNRAHIEAICLGVLRKRREADIRCRRRKEDPPHKNRSEFDEASKRDLGRDVGCCSDAPFPLRNHRRRCYGEDLL